ARRPVGAARKRRPWKQKGAKRPTWPPVPLHGRGVSGLTCEWESSSQDASGGQCAKLSDAHRERALALLVLAAAVSGRRRDGVADEAQQPSCPEPESGRDDEPEESPQNVTVVDLSDAGDDEGQDGGNTGLRHVLGSSWVCGNRA